MIGEFETTPDDSCGILSAPRSVGVRWNDDTSGRRAFVLAFGVALVLGALAVGEAGAAVFCQKRSGAAFIRNDCDKKETQVNLSAFGAVGPKGDKGDAGDTGDTGDKGDKGDTGDPGAPGSALGYARVLSDGTLVTGDSKNVTQANISKGNAGETCFANLPFTPHSAVATIEGTEPPSFVRVFTPRSGVSFALCPSGGQVEVFTNDADGTIAGHAFYIVFN